MTTADIYPGDLEEVPMKLVKYWFQRYDLFSRFDEGVWIDEEGWYSVTPEAIAKDTAERCKCDIIIDAFCGVGGNSIQFAKTCNKVIAIDINKQRLDCAKHNAEIYGVADKIEFIHGDFMELIPQLKADAVFLSPPWGGPEYADCEVFDLETMIPMNGLHLYNETRKITENIAYFLPRHCDPDLIGKLDPAHIVEIEQNYLSSALKSITAYFGKLAVASANLPDTE
ncbi:RNA cap guanine-N2 methyltransferase-domain-containing protein [Dimargaris cristalligena]|uniref:Trimethylguanosine synthase n=1 Tax=Dimargaris cristalligena TaxID=215637 RepID=A0A4Q0A203_9FUNG|nr:RNA cap guanine-N2 methyltransferase-domain-containing protein [Dimargaris cristalligena]|eukprot:RKP39838.1 RNA cap guanine-N2 methyltransferase-domain-containing protein [Dimargaris cristalligena]